jgi:hypothetical protein
MDGVGFVRLVRRLLCIIEWERKEGYIEYMKQRAKAEGG